MAKRNIHPLRQCIEILKAIEIVIRDSDVKTPDMGGNASTQELGNAVVDAL